MYAKHKNGRFYKGHVHDMEVYCKVTFEDGTYSEDMYQEDIEVNIERGLVVDIRIWFNRCNTFFKSHLHYFFDTSQLVFCCVFQSHDIAKNGPPRIGERINVFWPKENQFYKGTFEGFNETKTVIQVRITWDKCYVFVMNVWDCHWDTVIVIVIPPLWYRHCDTTIVIPLWWYHHCDTIMVIPPLWYHHCDTTTVMPSLWCCHCDAVIWMLWFWCGHSSVVIIMLFCLTGCIWGWDSAKCQEKGRMATKWKTSYKSVQ